MRDKTLKTLADKYETNIPAVILSWASKVGVGVVPQSSNNAHIKSNFDVYMNPLPLTDGEMETINALDGTDPICD